MFYILNGPGRSVAVGIAAKMSSVRDVAGPAHVFAETSAGGLRVYAEATPRSASSADGAAAGSLAPASASPIQKSAQKSKLTRTYGAI